MRGNGPLSRKDDKAETQTSISVYLQGSTSNLYLNHSCGLSPAHIVQSQLRIHIRDPGIHHKAGTHSPFPAWPMHQGVFSSNRVLKAKEPSHRVAIVPAPGLTASCKRIQCRGGLEGSHELRNSAVEAREDTRSSRLCALQPSLCAERHSCRTYETQQALAPRCI